MTIRITLAALALLSQTGCVAAIPLAAQLVSGANTSSQLCAMTKIPGQTATLCDRIASAMKDADPARREQLENLSRAIQWHRLFDVVGVLLEPAKKASGRKPGRRRLLGPVGPTYRHPRRATKDQ